MKDKLAVIVAVVSTLILVAIAAILFTRVPTADASWAQYAVLLGVFEALGYGGAGYLWGKEVHREQAESAEERAQASEEEASQAKTKAAEEAERGKGLGRAILAMQRTSGAGAVPQSEIETERERGEGRRSLSGQATTAESGNLNALADIARAQYPDLA
jgi:hypothetical protein